MTLLVGPGHKSERAVASVAYHGGVFRMPVVYTLLSGDRQNPKLKNPHYNLRFFRHHLEPFLGLHALSAVPQCLKASLVTDRVIASLASPPGCRTFSGGVDRVIDDSRRSQ
jgi:hypothetical protein